MSSNAELWQRRAAAVARGVSSSTQLFAERAVNAEIWDVASTSPAASAC